MWPAFDIAHCNNISLLFMKLVLLVINYIIFVLLGIMCCLAVREDLGAGRLDLSFI